MVQLILSILLLGVVVPAHYPDLADRVLVVMVATQDRQETTEQHQE